MKNILIMTLSFFSSYVAYMVNTSESDDTVKLLLNAGSPINAEVSRPVFFIINAG